MSDKSDYGVRRLLKYMAIKHRPAKIKDCRCESLEARIVALEEILKPTKVQADSWSIPVGQ